MYSLKWTISFVTYANIYNNSGLKDIMLGPLGFHNADAEFMGFWNRGKVSNEIRGFFTWIGTNVYAYAYSFKILASSRKNHREEKFGSFCIKMGLIQFHL